MNSLQKLMYSFRNTADKVKTSMRIEKKFPFFFVSMVLICIITALIRLVPVINDVYLIKAYDPWVQYSSVKYLVDNGAYEFFHWHSTKSWYPGGMERGELRPGLLFAAAIFYWVLNGLGIPVTVYEACFYFPVVMAILTIIVMYFLGKEVLDKRCGLLAAFFLAVNPGHAQRTVAGFFDNETIGVFSVLLVILFFIRATKSGKMTDGIFAGLSLGLLGLSWGGLTFAFLLLPLVTLILVLMNKYNGKVLMAYALAEGVGILIYIFFNTTFYLFPAKWTGEMGVFAPLGFLLILLIYHMFYFNKTSNSYNKLIRLIKVGILPVSLIVIFIFFYLPDMIPFGLGARLTSIINPSIREEINLVASVGEHMPSPWSVFYDNSLVCLLLVIPGIYFAFRRNNVEDIIMIVFILTLFYFTGSMIRIILLFAPAVNIIAAYALSIILKFFGELMKEKKSMDRRREKHVKKIVGRPEALTVYGLVAILLFVQLNHGAIVATTSLGYSEIMPGGVYHDWEESLTWMAQNIDPNAPIVSWWDYGYYITMVGNSTTVNDNGTWNQTRIGMTGMAMMQTNERYSAQVFRNLKAQYVLVYFGHLLGLSGDEGKWPWMLRICNDHSETYNDDPSIFHDNWYSDTQVFNEAEYVNGSTGLYEDSWFQSTLVKLMFQGEPATLDVATSGNPYPSQYFAMSLEGYSGSDHASVDQRSDDNGELWTSHIPTDSEGYVDYDFDFFKKTYFSLNNLVKIFEVDYTALDSGFKVLDTYLENNGVGYALIENTGLLDIGIDSVEIDGQSLPITVQKGDQKIAPGEERYVIFNVDDDFIQNNNLYQVSVGASVEKDDGSYYTFTNDSLITEIVKDSEFKISTEVFINREESRLFLNSFNGAEEAFITVENNGETPLIISNITIANENDYIKIETNNSGSLFSKDYGVESSWDKSDYTSSNYVITPGESETYYFSSNVMGDDEYIGEIKSVIIDCIGQETDATVLSYNHKNQKLQILGDTQLSYLAEDSLMYDYTTYSNIESGSNHSYVDYNLDSYLYDNGTFSLKIQNQGDELIALGDIYIDGETETELVPGVDWFTKYLNGTLDTLGVLEPYETRIVDGTLSDIENNKPVSITIIGTRTADNSSDCAYFVPISSTSRISIIDDDNSRTALFTNETLEIVVKNTGSSSINLTQMTLNDTVVALTTDYIVEGSNPGNLTLAPFDIALIQYNISNDFQINATNSLLVNVSTDAMVYSQTTVLESILPSDESFVILTPENQLEDPEYPPEIIGGDVSFSLISNILANVTIDSIQLRINETNSYVSLSLIADDYRFADDNEEDLVGSWDLPNNLPVFLVFNVESLTPHDLSLSSGDTLYIKVVTKEGYEAEESVLIP